MCTTRKKRVQFKNKLQLKHRKFLRNLCSNRRYFCNGTFFCSFARRCYFDSKINPINLNCPKQKRSFAHLLTMHRVGGSAILVKSFTGFAISIFEHTAQRWNCFSSGLAVCEITESDITATSVEKDEFVIWSKFHLLSVLAYVSEWKWGKHTLPCTDTHAHWQIAFCFLFYTKYSICWKCTLLAPCLPTAMFAYMNRRV